ncbi:hypothetical protein [Pedobacter sp. GR22-6]|uniref:hypothetical protein n=1 Tax=Pedobacter sp. GR22-6 TaxID=3127957 RepID=UPI00307D7963
MENAITELEHIIAVLSRPDIKKHELIDTQVINRVLQEAAGFADQKEQVQMLSANASLKLEELCQIKYPSELQLASIMRLKRITKSLQESAPAHQELNQTFQQGIRYRT